MDNPKITSKVELNKRNKTIIISLIESVHTKYVNDIAKKKSS